jgi:sugar (pentulose or hexulose) kinase
MGVGAFPDWNQVGRFVRPAAVVQPDPAWVARYDALYPLWREIYDRLRPLYPRLAATVQEA